MLLSVIAVPCHAMEFTAPPVPETGQRYMPDETDSFGEGLRFVLKNALESIHPALTEALQTCASIIAVTLTVGFLCNIAPEANRISSMAGVAASSLLILRSANSLIHLGTDTVQQLSQYGKLLLPVMTGALAAQGSVTKSGALYAATAFFDSILATAVSDLLTPLVYVFLCTSTVSRLADLPLLTQIKSSVKWLITWGLKTILYVFTGYISITGVVSGTTDAAMLKATKLTISSMVPVVGSILSDASEAVLVSAGLMKNAAGIYGLLAMIAVGIGPFLRVGLQYLLLKLCSGICHTFGVSRIGDLVKDYSDTMGLILAMIGTVCILLMISTICFMRGAG